MRRISGLVAAVVVLGGCGWAHPRFDTANTGSNPYETAISVGTVSGLTEQFRMAVDPLGGVQPFVVARGRVYAGARATSAFDGSGQQECSGAVPTCTALWRYDAGAIPDVYDDVLYLGPGAYDADGISGCAGVPRVCAPSWTEGAGAGSTPHGPTDPASLHLAWHAGPFTPGGVLAAVHGYERDCASTAPDCPLRWAGETLYGFGANVLSRPATDGSRVFASYTSSATATSGTLYAWDGAQAPGSRLWSASLPGRSTDFVAVAEGVVVVVVQAASGGMLVAYDAAGVTNCSGTPAVCQPLWTSEPWTAVGTPRAPALAGGKVFFTWGSSLAAYDLHGSRGCTGTPTICSPDWVAGTGDGITAPSVAGGVVFVSDQNGSVRAYDADGVVNCSPTIRRCGPLWSTFIDLVTGAPVVAGGRVYVAANDGTVYVYGLPD